MWLHRLRSDTSVITPSSPFISPKFSDQITCCYFLDGPSHGAHARTHTHTVTAGPPGLQPAHKSASASLPPRTVRPSRLYQLLLMTKGRVESTVQRAGGGREGEDVDPTGLFSSSVLPVTVICAAPPGVNTQPVM